LFLFFLSFFSLESKRKKTQIKKLISEVCLENKKKKKRLKRVFEFLLPLSLLLLCVFFIERESVSREKERDDRGHAFVVYKKLRLPITVPFRRVLGRVWCIFER
jgi:hypothetical protein